MFASHLGDFIHMLASEILPWEWKLMAHVVFCFDWMDVESKSIHSLPGFYAGFARARVEARVKIGKGQLVMVALFVG
jgi:hypothetical protein